MTILAQPIRVDREAERISVFNGGASLDFNGNEQLRREAMRFYEQAPAAFRLLHTIRDTLVEEGASGPSIEAMDTILRDAGVLP